jgi:glutathione S-transferase
MDLYFSPLACSMAARISLYEANAPARYVEVDPKSKRTTEAGDDYFAVNPIGLVPAIRTDEGDVLTENAAVLQYIADRWPDADLAPRGGFERSRLHQWLCFVGTELHKGLFIPLFDRSLSEAARARTVEKGAVRFNHLDRHLTGREFLLDRFSVADAYLFTVLNWAQAVSVDLTPWPNVLAYYKRLRQRTCIARAFNEERALYVEEQKRHQAA